MAVIYKQKNAAGGQMRGYACIHKSERIKRLRFVDLSATFCDIILWILLTVVLKK